MTYVSKRFFDELAHSLRVNKVGNALILQIADVCARGNANFHRDWFLDAAGYTPVTSKVKVLKLGNKTRVVPITPRQDGFMHPDDPAPTDEEIEAAFAPTMRDYHDYTDERSDEEKAASKRAAAEYFLKGGNK